jgi:hypothetical protein
MQNHGSRLLGPALLAVFLMLLSGFAYSLAPGYLLTDYMVLSQET